MQNENPTSESNVSLTNNEKNSKPKILTENKHHRANYSFIPWENNKEKKKKNEEQCYKKTLILEDYIIKHVDSWRLNQRMKYIVSVCQIFGATTKAMKHHVMGCLEDESPDTIAMHHGKRWKAEKIASNIINLALC